MWKILSKIIIGLFDTIAEIALAFKAGELKADKDQAEYDKEQMEKYEKTNSKPDVDKPFGRMRSSK